jgi:death-on-curing protein
MIILTTAEIIEMHKKITAATGGSSGIRDIKLLDSAVQNCYQSFGGVDLYPTSIDKAARMAYAINKNHPFIDGNKRTAVTAMLVILRMNDIELSYSQQELVVLGLNIARGSIAYEDIIKWIEIHQEN